MNIITTIEPKQAFNHAIATGDLSDKHDSPDFAGLYMFMYATDKLLYFKHINTREYLHVPYSFTLTKHHA